MTELRLALKALLSHYWRHPWQALFLLVGLCAGVGLWSAVQVINTHARASYQEANQLLGAQAQFWIRAQDGKGVALDEYVALRRQGFRQIYPIVQSMVRAADGTHFNLIATDPLALPAPTAAVSTQSAQDFNGLAFMQPPYQAWFPPDLAQELQLKAGEQLMLANGQTLPPALLQTQSQQGRQVLLDIAPALKLLQQTQLSYLAVGVLSASEQQALETALPKHLTLTPNRQSLDLTQLTQSLHTQLTAMSLLSFAVGLFIVFNAVRFSLWYRRPTLRTLRLVGVSVSTLSVAIGLETVLWSVVGSGLGLAIGYGLSHVLLPTVSSSLSSLYGASLGSTIILAPQTIFIAWLLTLGGLVLALAWPLWRQLKLPVLPSYALSTHWLTDQITRKRLAIVAVVLAVVALVSYPFINTLTQGFVLLGIVLLAGAWGLPWLLAQSLKGLEALLPQNWFQGRWLIRDGWAQLPALRTAMMALLLALTANLGVEMLVGSFRTALSGWLEQRLAADLYVQGSSQFKLDALLAQPHLDTWLKAYHPRTQAQTRWHDHQTQLRGIKTDAPDIQSLELIQALPDAKANWASPANQTPNAKNWVLANEQLHYLGGVQLGQTVTLNLPKGEATFTIAGFIHDYGNPYFQLQLPTALLTHYWPNPEPWGLALWLQDPTNLTQAEQALIQAGAKAGDWTTQSAIKGISFKIFDRTFAMTAAMNTLTLWVAGIALLAALMAILQERLPEFAQWKALGVTQGEQLAVMSVPLLVWALVTWLVSLPLGGLLTWILIHKLNVMAFGWSMPLLWTMRPAWYLLALTLGVIALTLLLVNWQLKRQLPQALARLGGQA